MVKLNIKILKELENAAIDIKDAAGEDMEVFLLQRVEGQGKFIAAVMFGLECVFTE